MLTAWFVVSYSFLYLIQLLLPSLTCKLDYLCKFDILNNVAQLSEIGSIDSINS